MFLVVVAAGAINVQPGNVQPWWIRYSLVLFEEGRDFDSLAFLRRVQAKFEGVGEVRGANSVLLYLQAFSFLIWDFFYACVVGSGTGEGGGGGFAHRIGLL